MSCKGTLVLFLIALLSILELNCDYQSVNAVQLSTQMKMCSLPYYFFFFFQNMSLFDASLQCK